MSLSGQQCKELQEALVDAFPAKSSLERMLLFELDKKLDEIAGGNNLQDTVFELIKVANAQEWVEDLIKAAYNSNYRNQKLSNFVGDLIIQDDDKISAAIKQILENKDYFISRKIGAGEFCITYLASRKIDKNKLVIKTIKAEIIYKYITSSNQDDLDMFERAIKSCEKEAQLLSDFKPPHPNIVEYHQYFKHKCKMLINNLSDNRCSVKELELLFLVMKYIEGEDLEKLVNRRGAPLEEAEALRYIQQIGEALTVVHSKGVLHRDIKPQNIMVRKDTQNVVLIDFGIAREFNLNVTQAHTVSFTEGYAPPEQLEEKAKRGNYTDIYGLAATLYYLLTKKHPSHALFRKTQPLDEPKKINPHISDRVNEAILWGMELEPSNRPQKVREWLVELVSKTSIESKSSQKTPTKPSILKPLQTDNLSRDRSDDLLFNQAEQLESAPSDDLSSDRGVDYTRLRDLLKAGRWQQADEETLAVMLEAAHREEKGWLNGEDIENFPCKDLRTINKLWVEYSNNRFGFSVQKRIWERVDRSYEKFGDAIGWRKGSWMNKDWIKYSDVTFDTTAREGHLPLLWPCIGTGIRGERVPPARVWLRGWLGVGFDWTSQDGAQGRRGLFSRIKTCKL